MGVQGESRVSLSALYDLPTRPALPLKPVGLGVEHLLQSLESLPTPFGMAIAGRNQRFGLTDHATQISEARIAEVAVMDVRTDRYAAGTCNFRLTRLAIYISHARFLSWIITLSNRAYRCQQSISCGPRSATPSGYLDKDVARPKVVLEFQAIQVANRAVSVPVQGGIVEADALVVAPERVLEL